MLKIAESYQFNKRNGKWYFHDMNFMLYQTQWNGSNLCSNTRDRWKWCIYDIHDMKDKKVNYYTNNYTAFLWVEIKLWQKLQIIFSFGLTLGILRVERLILEVFFLCPLCMIFSLLLLCRNFFRVIADPPPPPPPKKKNNNKMVHP